MKFTCENSKGLKAVNYFHKEIPSEMFGWILNIADIQTFERKT